MPSHGPACRLPEPQPQPAGPRHTQAPRGTEVRAAPAASAPARAQAQTAGGSRSSRTAAAAAPLRPTAGTGAGGFSIKKDRGRLTPEERAAQRQHGAAPKAAAACTGGPPKLPPSRAPPSRRQPWVAAWAAPEATPTPPLQRGWALPQGSKSGTGQPVGRTQTSTATPRMPVAASRCSAALNHLEEA